MAVQKKKKAAIKHTTLGFGVPATSDPHHFLVQVPAGNSKPILILEHLGMQMHDQTVIDRVSLPRKRWVAIRDVVKRVFNARLKEKDLKAGTWKTGDNPVDRLLGRELCVLAWAVEGMDEDKVPVAIRNWITLQPEERWWLYSMTAQGTGGLNDIGKGWRLALRHALGDVARTETLSPDGARALSLTDKQISFELIG